MQNTLVIESAPLDHSRMSEEQIDDIAAEYSDEFGHINPDQWLPFANALIAAYENNKQKSPTLRRSE